MKTAANFIAVFIKNILACLGGWLDEDMADKQVIKNMEEYHKYIYGSKGERKCKD